jgi:hypothetical protein
MHAGSRACKRATAVVRLVFHAAQRHPLQAAGGPTFALQIESQKPEEALRPQSRYLSRYPSSRRWWQSTFAVAFVPAPMRGRRDRLQRAAAGHAGLQLLHHRHTSAILAAMRVKRMGGGGG